MQLSSNVAFSPAVDAGSLTAGDAFRAHVGRASILTDAAIFSLSQGPEFINVISPVVVGTASARQAVAELNTALQQNVPDAARVAAQNAQQLLTLGVRQLTLRSYPSVPTGQVLGNFSAAMASMQTALDVLDTPAAHIQLPSPDSPIQ